MPGWGASDAVTRDEVDHAKAAVELLDALGIERAAFVGNSMGGITTLRLATEHPERVSHVITMGPGSGPQPKPVLARRRPVRGDEDARRGLPGAVARSR